MLLTNAPDPGGPCLRGQEPVQKMLQEEAQVLKKTEASLVRISREKGSSGKLVPRSTRRRCR